MEDVYDRVEKACKELMLQKIEFVRYNFPYYAHHGISHVMEVAEYADRLLFTDRKRPILAILRCAAYLHDIGMALLPPEIDKLELEIDTTYVKKLFKLETCEDKKAECYTRYFAECRDAGPCQCVSTNKVLTVVIGGQHHVRGVCDQFEWGDFLRKIHPWASAKYVTTYLPPLLHMLRKSDAHLFAEAVATVIKGHSRHLEPYMSGTLWGIDLAKITRKLSAALILADALDFTRTKIIDSTVEVIMKQCPTQLKHWVFKNYVEKIDIKGRKIVIHTDYQPGNLEFIGLLAFELGGNFAHDFRRAQELNDDYKNIKICINNQSKKYDVTKIVDELYKFLQETTKEENKKQAEELLGQIFGVKLCEETPEKRGEEARKERCGGKCEVDPFDLLAFAVAKNKGREKVKAFFEIIGFSNITQKLPHCE